MSIVDFNTLVNTMLNEIMLKGKKKTGKGGWREMSGRGGYLGTGEDGRKRMEWE